MSAQPPVRLLVATTVPESAWGLLRGQLAYLDRHGFSTVLVSSPGAQLDAVGAREGVRTVGVEMSRRISVRADAVALCRLLRVFRRERPDIAMVGTPKASLLAGLAAFLTRVPRRIYLLRGLRLETARGLQWVVLWLAERLVTATAHEVIAVSPSLLEEARRLRLVGADDGCVLGRGGSNGVALAPDTPSDRSRALRRRVDPDGDAVVFGFVGRLTRDKGVLELLEAFRAVAAQRPSARLVLAGSEDESDLEPAVLEMLRTDPRITHLGWLDDPSFVFSAVDVFVLPTYREGLPTVTLEASGAGRPVISTSATGARDAVVDGVTGILVPPADAGALASAMSDLASDPGMRQRMGDAGRAFVAANFTNEVVWSNLRDHLRDPNGSVSPVSRPVIGVVVGR